jgi:hypothetical protein
VKKELPPVVCEIEVLPEEDFYRDDWRATSFV